MYEYVKVTGGYDIYLDGMWWGWSAGSKADAKRTVRECK